MKRILALLLTVFLCFGLCACGSTSKQAKSSIENVVIYASIGEDGKAYIPMMDGTVITINGDVIEAIITADRKNIVVLEKDGLLYVTTPADVSKKTTIADNADYISTIKSAGIIYVDDDLGAYRYTFENSENVSLGTDLAIVAARNTLSALLADDAGNVFTIPYNATEKEKVSTYKESIELEAISDDGKTAVWVELDEDAETHTIYLCANGERQKIEEVDYENNYTYAQFNKNFSFMAIANPYSDKVHFMSNGSTELTTAKLGSELSSSTLYTKNGPLVQEASDAVDGLYVLTEGNSEANLYYVNSNGDREKMLSDVIDVEIANGRIYYLTEEEELYTASLNGYALENETKVASDVYVFLVVSDGNYAYYIKSIDDNDVGSLYRYSVKEENAEKISSKAYNYTSIYIHWPYPDFYVSTDGRTVYYFQEVTEVEETYDSIGTLMCATVGSEPVKIASDVVVYRPDSGIDGNAINPNSFTFNKYMSVDDDDNLIVNLVYYNGTETVTLAKDVYDDNPY